MDLIDNSSHICLVCNQTVIGLYSYVEHFKGHATPQESNIFEEKLSRDIADREGRINKEAVVESNQKTGESLPTSPLTDLGVTFTDPDIETSVALEQNQDLPDFFQSLELKSTAEESPSKAKLKAVQRLSILEDDNQAELLLPITSILSNLDFSSDDEEYDLFGFVDDENVDAEEDFWLNDDLESSSHPPEGHTGGKWKPGQGPKQRMAIAGKWRPGQKPGPACRKNILRRPAKVKGSKDDVTKSFYCNVCHSFFMDRNVYSLHFAQARHQELAEAKNRKETADHTPNADVTGQSLRATASDTSAVSQPERQAELTKSQLQSQAIATESQTLNKEISHIESHFQSQKHVTTESQIPAKVKGFHCQDCDLYFENTVVLKTHCETKQHKDAVLKKGFREFDGGDGVVFRVDLRTETVHKETREASLPMFDLAKRSQPQQNYSGPPEPVKEAESHKCPICVKHFTRKYEMARHLLTRMHANRAKGHPEASSIEMLERYNKYMVRLMPFQCGVCRYYFNRQKDFLDHMGSLSHLTTCEDMLGPILCIACKFKTHNHEEMMAHLQYPSHYAEVEKNHKICVVKESHTGITCKFCGLRLHSAVRMKQHWERKHQDRMIGSKLALDTRPVEHILHKCPLCEKSYKAKSLLQLHFLKVHKQESLFNCDICDRGFLDQRRLDNHLRTRFHAKRVMAKNTASSQQHDDETSRNNQEDYVQPSNGKSQASTQTVIDQRRSGRKRKLVKFFDGSDNEGDDMTMKEGKKNGETPVSKLVASSSSSKETKRKTGSQGRNKIANGVARKVKGQGKLKISTVKKGSSPDHTDTAKLSSDNIDTTKLLSGNISTTKSTTHILSADEEEEDEEIIIEQEAIEDDGEVEEEPTGLEAEEVDKEEHARVNMASLTIFSCTYCDFAATDLLELRAHFTSNHPNEVLACQPCDQFFLSLKAYKIHCAGRGHQLKLRELSGDTTIHKCRLCDKRFLQEFSCKLHLETVHRHPRGEEDLKRIHKGQDLVSQLYGEHIKQVESLHNEMSVSCPECGKFVRKDTLVEHLRLHTGERPYTCRFCGRGFAGRLTLRRHLSGHLDMPLFICDLCGKGFKRNGLLQQHMKHHEHEQRGEKHECRICKAWFYTPEELERHSRRHGDRTFHCTWPGCKWSFIQAGELKSHMHTHTKEKKYLCDQCGFGAPTRTRLRRHAKSHFKVREFVCEYCPYKASIKTHLRRHMRIHINSKPFKCPYCKYTCNTHENMRKHILRTQKHKGKKLYPCHLCNNTFGCDSSREFRAHLMTEHAGYLKENAVDSLAVFSGLYKREEDFQKPKEGSEIIQVTKGRFFRSYQNPASIPPLVNKMKKPKGKNQGHKVKATELKVRIVPPEEMQQDLELDARAKPSKEMRPGSGECHEQTNLSGKEPTAELTITLADTSRQQQRLQPQKLQLQPQPQQKQAVHHHHQQPQQAAASLTAVNPQHRAAPLPTVATKTEWNVNHHYRHNKHQQILHHLTQPVQNSPHPHHPPPTQQQPIHLQPHSTHQSATPEPWYSGLSHVHVSSNHEVHSSHRARVVVSATNNDQTAYPSNQADYYSGQVPTTATVQQQEHVYATNNIVVVHTDQVVAPTAGPNSQPKEVEVFFSSRN